MNISSWNRKRFYSLDAYLREQFGCKVYKLALNGGMTCPNRDGTLDTRGCIFCSKGGSGDFSAPSDLSIREQLIYGREKLRHKLAGNYDTCKYIAYFQSYTNTYAPVDYLEKIFTEAIIQPEVAVLSIATRPDCISDDIIKLLDRLNQIKPVWIELGLQTIHESGAVFIRRGYPLPVYDNCVQLLKEHKLPIITHLILGLPGETRDMMLQSAAHVAASPVKGIKLQLLHIMSGTDLGELYDSSPDLTDSLYIKKPEDYISLLVSILEILPSDMVIHRLTGDAPKDRLLYPLWSSNKRLILNGLAKELKIRDTCQGIKYNKTM